MHRKTEFMLTASIPLSIRVVRPARLSSRHGDVLRSCMGWTRQSLVQFKRSLTASFAMYASVWSVWST
ncbi:hypothetical protein D3C81_2006700 [compost metagenome]